MKSMRLQFICPLALGIAACMPAGEAQAAPASPPTPAQTSAHSAAAVPAKLFAPEIKTPLGEMPGVDALPALKDLPDPLAMNDGTKVTTPEQWAKRREEMKRTLEYYATGAMPPPPGNVKGETMREATALDGKVKYRLVHLTFGADSKLGLNIGVFTPTEGGPFPTVILQTGTPPLAEVLARMPPSRGRDAIPGSPAPPDAGPDKVKPASSNPDSAAAASSTAPPAASSANAVASFFAQHTPEEAAEMNRIVLDRGYALVTFNPNDCAEDTTLREPDGSFAFRTTRFATAYPNYDWGVLTIWAWGASRAADYLVTDPAIDKTRLIITGPSRYGKSSMIAAAFDERLMGAPMITGGGGIGAYRIAGPDHSETLESMGLRFPNWFSPHLLQFMGKKDKLPFDQHWFMALAAPRPFIALEGDADSISWPEAVKASLEGARKAYAFLGAPDKIGIHYSEHNHTVTQQDWNALLDFFDKHALGKPVDMTFDHYLTEAETKAARSRPKPTQP